MNKAKRDLNALKLYLAKDREGQELLKAVSQTLIDQRKEIGTLREQKTGLEQAKAAARAERDAVQEEHNKLELELLQLRSQHDSLSSRCKLLEQRLAAKLAEEEEPLLTHPNSEDELLEFFMRNLRYLKSKRGLYPSGSHTNSYNVVLESIMNKCSTDDLLTVGRFAFVFSLFGLPFGLESGHRVRELSGWTDAHEDEVQDTLRKLGKKDSGQTWKSEVRRRITLDDDD